MTTDERLLRLENAFTTLAELASSHHQRMSTLEQSFQTLVELARGAEERMDQHLSWINQLGDAQANSESRIAALADAQIRTDEALVKLIEAQTKLAESQAHTDRRLDALIDIVREWRNGKS
jgi:DNA repair exonuclease SbcCD ATPase subunit